MAVLARLRRLGQACVEGQRIAYSGAREDPEQIAAQIEQRIFAAGEQAAASSGYRSAKEVLREVVEEVDGRYTGTRDHGMTTGLVDLDRQLGGLEPGQLIIVGARPAMGKSAFALGVALHVAALGRAVVLHSLEMGATELMQRACAIKASVSLQAIRTGRLAAEQWPALSSAVQDLAELPLHIDDSGAIRPSELASRCRRRKRQAGDLGLVVVDYLQLMVPDRGRRSDNRVNELTAISASLKGLAKELHCPVIALSQLNRSLEHRPNKRPTLADLRESGSIEQDADIVLMIYRDAIYNEDSKDKGVAEIIIAKQRNGPIGTIKTVFMDETTRFANHTTMGAT